MIDYDTKGCNSRQQHPPVLTSSLIHEEEGSLSITLFPPDGIRSGKLKSTLCALVQNGLLLLHQYVVPHPQSALDEGSSLGLGLKQLLLNTTRTQQEETSEIIKGKVTSVCLTFS
jgi:hypothetical protein